MVAGFHRSHAASDGPSYCASPFHRPRATTKPNHVRSTSVPCCSHPALAHLQHETQSVLSLPAISETGGSVANWLADGLDRINRVHAALGCLLHLRPSANTGAWADRLLDDTLCLADAYASLRSTADSLRHHASEARTAIRRGDSVRLASALRSHRHAEKELSRLATTIKDVARPSQALTSELMGKDATEVEFAGTIREAVAATATASAAILTRIAALSSSTTAAVASTSKDSSASWSLKRLGLPRSGRKREVAEETGAVAEIVAFEKLEGLEESLERLERGSEGVFRSLVSTRVSLLNIFTHSW